MQTHGSKLQRTLGFLVTLALFSGNLSLRAQSYLDTVVFGNSNSESAHVFVGPNTMVVSNSAVSPTQTARRGLTNNPVTIYGGSLTFKLAVDPVRRNYFTVKLWGSDELVGLSQDSDIGRLYLYVPASNFVAGATNNYQVGYRHEGDYDVLNTAGYKPPVAGRFFYSTTLLPLWMTQGRTNLTLTIQPGGRIYDLGSGGPPSGNYQFNMITNSRGIYQAYTHTEAVLNPAGEVQGSAPTTTMRPNTGSTAGVATMSSGGSFWNRINSQLNNLLNKNASDFSDGDVLNLALGYGVTNFPIVYTNAAVVTKVTQALDNYASNYYANPGDAGGDWGGAYGNLGRAISVLLPQLQSSLDVTVNYGGGRNFTRRQAWGDMLVASRDYGRANRNTLANQNLIANESIYWANRGLLALSNANAFPENEGQRYLREAIGVEPWLGNDLAGGGHSYSFGTNYYMITPKGLSREWGYVGYGYGEMQTYAANFYEWTSNSVFLTQAVKMAKARASFRRPSVEVSGANNYRSMEAISILSWRGAAESDSQFASEITYADRSLTGNGMRCAAVTMDTNLIGYAKQQLSDGQYFYWLQYPNLGPDSLKIFSDYEKVAAATDSGVRLPMTDGQPDFAWADEENGIISAKRGNEKLWLSTYWQAGKATGINGIGRFLYETNTFACYGVLEVTPQFTASGAFIYRANLVDMPYKTVYTPPDNPSNAYAGEPLPLAASDLLANDGEPFVGKANFWACRYGNFLIGINRSSTTSYELKTPSGFTSATNLITGQNLNGTVMVVPQSTVILYLNSATDNNPLPSPPLMLNAVGSAVPQVKLDWTVASGATGYNVKRAQTKGGPYTSIANVTTTNYTDTGVALGGVYYYVVSGTNSNGESACDSMEAFGSAGLPSPWQDVDVGTPNLPGKADYVNGVFAVRGNGVDIGGSSDSFHYVYQNMTTNDGSIVVRLAAMQPSSSSDKVAVMIRASTNANSMAAVLMYDTTSGFHSVRFACRTGNGSGMSYSWNGPYIAGAPVWLRITRSGGTTYTAAFSDDGSSWTPVGTNTFSMTGTVLAGMAVCVRFSSTSYNFSTFDNISLSGWSNLPAIPTGLAATAGNAQVALNWNASSSAMSYNVKRSTTSGSGYVTITNVTDASVVNIGLNNGTTYYYVVSALNAGGESGNSSQVSATPQVSAPATPTGLAATAGNAQVSLSWNASSGATSYNVKRSTTSGSGYVTVTNVTGTSVVNVGLNNGTTYYYVVSAVNGGGESGNSSQVSATPQSSLPSPWATADIGAVGATGSATYSSGTFTVIGSGVDIWGTADEFRYVYQTASGNCSIVARVTGVQNVHSNAKAGVMIRESLNANSRHAMVNITPAAGIEFLRRTSTGGSTTGVSVGGLTAPYWLRITRSSNTFTASYSTDGSSWTTLGTQNINMSTSVYIGLIVNSHIDGTLCTGTFTNVTATP